MLPSEILELWLSGECVDVVAPGLRPEALHEQLPAGRRLLVVTPDDGTALLASARLGHAPLLRTTGAEDRNRLLGRSLIVTSLDSLHVPSLRSLLVTELTDAARLLLGACRLDGRLSGNLGRAAFEQDLLGPARLRVHSLVSTAPEGAPVLAEGPGVVVRSDSSASELAGLGGGVVLGALPGLTAAAHNGGLPVRQHELRRPFARGWIGASIAVAEAARGFDVLSGLAPLPIVGSAPVYWPGPFRGGFVADGSLFLGEAGRAQDEVEPESLAAVLSQVERDGGWTVFPGDRPETTALLEDLVTVGVLGRLRPAWGTARVADAKRFRSPFADREPAWKALADRYAEALRRWSLGERTRLALSDQSPRDLVELARALGTDLAALSDTLMDLDAANVIAARTEATAGAWDLQVRRGRDFGLPAEETLERLVALRAERRALEESIDEALAVQGCSTVAWRTATTGVGGEPCGLCGHCDPSGDALRARGGGSASTTFDATGRGSSARQEARASLQGLFGSLPDRPESAAPEDPLDLARSGEPADLERAIELAGSPAALYLLGLYRHNAPSGKAALPFAEPVVEAMVRVLEGDASPTPSAESMDVGAASVRRGRSGNWTVKLSSEGPGLWRFVAQSSGHWESDALARLKGRSPRLAELAEARRCQAAWTQAARGLEGRLVQWLDRHDGVPGPTQLATLLGEPLPSAHPAWAPLFARWAQLAGRAERSPEVLAEPVPSALPGRRVIEMLSRLVGQDQEALLETGRGLLTDAAPSRPIDRLLLRSLTLLQPALTAEELLRWTERPERPADPGPLVERLTGGRRGTFARLAGLLQPELRPSLLARAVALRRVPRELFDEALAAASEPSEVAAVLVGATPAPDRARKVWDSVRERIAPDSHGLLFAALSEFDGKGAAALAKVVGAEEDRRAAARRDRAAVLELAEKGHLGQAATRLAALENWEENSTPEERAAFDAVRLKAIERQKSLLGPIIAALAGTAGPGGDDAAFGALEDSVQEGFGPAVVALLSRQYRRAPQDVRRALWFARALALNGEWGDAQRVYRAAAQEHTDLRKRFETEFEGVFLAFDEGQGKRALGWMSDLLSTPWHQVLAPHVDGLISEDIVPPDQRAALADLLAGTGSPFYTKAVERLRGS